MSELSVGQLKGLAVNNNVITVPGNHTLYAPGHVIQVQEFRGGAELTTTGPVVDIINASITTKSTSSRLYIQYYTGQILVESVSSNPRITFFVDGVDQGLDTDHIFYGAGTGFRPVVTIPVLSTSTVSAGVHTVSVKGSSYNSGLIRYNYQSSGSDARRSRLIVIEVAA